MLMFALILLLGMGAFVAGVIIWFGSASYRRERRDRARHRARRHRSRQKNEGPEG